jgi:hypothetical protein
MKKKENKGRKSDYDTTKVATAIERELRKLKELLGQELRIEWVPNEGSRLDGEIKNGILYIYTTEKTKVLEIAKHELLDYVLTNTLVTPLIYIINSLIKQREREIYQRKEELVKRLCNPLIWGMEIGGYSR